MTRALFFIILISVFSFSSCLQKVPPIDLANVDSIKLIPHFPDDTISEPPITLNDLCTKKFIAELNEAHSDGSCKYYPFYNIIVYMKNGVQRNFRANGCNIKENTDECFVIGNNDYFAILYKEGQKANP